MEIVFTVLVLLMAVALSNIIARLVPFHIPVPLMQVTFGALLAFPVFNLHIAFNPEVFLLLFIPPLLFVDGWRIPKRDFFHQHLAILMMALGLVFFTVLGVGLFIHLLIPGVPLAAAFALAAVLSPTDAVAVSGIVGRSRVPKSIMNLLEGEALMNDASGLVALKFAVVAMLTGMFSVYEASVSFFFIAIGGVAIGIGISFLASKILQWIARYAGEDAATQTVFLLLLPFISYIVAERAGTSGILAAVTAGITQSYTKTMSNSLTMRLRSESIWEMLEFVFNGMIFILLGLQLPHIMGHLPDYTNANHPATLKQVLFYIIAISVVLFALRFAWVALLARFLVHRAKKRDEIPPIANKGDIAVLTLAGVRGAVTLAGVLSIPMFLYDGSPFPARGLLIFLAAGVIVFSLIAATIGLPVLIRHRQQEDAEDDINQIKTLLRERAKAAITAVEAIRQYQMQNISEENQIFLDEIGARVLARYHEQLIAGGDNDDAQLRPREMRKLEIDMNLAALRAERSVLNQPYINQNIDEIFIHEQLRELDLAEATLLQRAERVSKS